MNGAWGQDIMLILYAAPWPGITGLWLFGLPIVGNPSIFVMAPGTFCLPIRCQVIWLPETPLPDVHVLLEYRGCKFEALTSHDGYITSWEPYNFNGSFLLPKANQDYNWCYLSFSGSLWGKIETRYRVQNCTHYLFILRWSWSSYTIESLSTPPLSRTKRKKRRKRRKRILRSKV
jgi:hypothetical protein